MGVNVNIRAWAAAGCIALAASCSGDPEPRDGEQGASCASDEQCTGGFFCTDGECRQLCIVDNDCVIGTVCTDDLCSSCAFAENAADRPQCHPAPFQVLLDVEDAELGEPYSSNPVFIAPHISSSRAQVGPGATLVRNGDDTVGRDTQVTAGDAVAIRMQASANYFETMNAVLLVDTYEFPWSITTKHDYDPGPIAFDDLTGLEPGGAQISNVVTLNAFEGSLTLELTGDAAATPWVNGVEVAADVSVQAGDTIELRATAPVEFNQAVTTTVTIGEASDIWALRTRPFDPTPNALEFVTVPRAQPGDIIISNTVTLSGLDGEHEMTVDDVSGVQIVLGEEAPATTALLSVGDVISLTMVASEALATTKIATVTMGNYFTTWTVTTRPTSECDNRDYNLTGIADAGEFAVIYHDSHRLYLCTLYAPTNGWSEDPQCGSGLANPSDATCAVDAVDYVVDSVSTYRCNADVTEVATEPGNWKQAAGTVVDAIPCFVGVE